jgi:hypothetical protein
MTKQRDNDIKIEKGRKKREKRGKGIFLFEIAHSF